MDVAQSKFATTHVLHACEEVEKRGVSDLDTNVFENDVRASPTANEDTLTTCGPSKRGPQMFSEKYTLGFALQEIDWLQQYQMRRQ
jgi:hypothetical protein